MLAMAGFPTDRETPPILGFRVFAKGLRVVHGNLHVAPRVRMLATLHYHSVGPPQSPIVGVELKVRQALWDC